MNWFRRQWKNIRYYRGYKLFIKKVVINLRVNEGSEDRVSNVSSTGIRTAHNWTVEATVNTEVGTDILKEDTKILEVTDHLSANAVPSTSAFTGNRNILKKNTWRNGVVPGIVEGDISVLVQVDEGRTRAVSLLTITVPVKSTEEKNSEARTLTDDTVSRVVAVL